MWVDVWYTFPYGRAACFPLKQKRQPPPLTTCMACIEPESLCIAKNTQSIHISCSLQPACLPTWRSAIPAAPPPPPTPGARRGGPLAKFVEPSNADVSAENDGSGVDSGAGSFFPLNQLMLSNVSRTAVQQQHGDADHELTSVDARGPDME